jgi:hypothetical protein
LGYNVEWLHALHIKMGVSESLRREFWNINMEMLKENDEMKQN